MHGLGRPKSKNDTYGDEDVRTQNGFSSKIRKYPLLFIFLLMILPVTYTVPHVFMAPENPDGEIPFPTNISVESDGFVLIVLDGVGRDYFLDDELMPEINNYRARSATANVITGPLTLSATCISEMMTGVPNAPINGLRNFDLNHPGNNDPWLLAANDPRYKVGIVGSYVMGNLYSSFEEINFQNTFKGHSDYYDGDLETLEVANDWLSNSMFNVMAIHFSGPDKVGHTWGADSDEYRDKLLHVDKQVSSLLQLIPQNWSVVVTADHGMTDMGTHGSSEDITREVAAIISGPKVSVGSSTNIHQRDISAMMPMVLGLPFPIQLHGKIPLDIFDHSQTENSVLELWNWEAAYQRHLFFEVDGSETKLSPNEADWDSITQDGEFSRTIDIYISIFTWILISCFVLLALGISSKQISQNWKIFGIFGCCISVSLLSHALLKYSAMIPRAIGGLCSVWLVGYSLSSSNKEESPNKFSMFTNDLLHKPFFWVSLFLLISFLSWSILIATVSTLSIYSIIYSMQCSFAKEPQSKTKNLSYLPLILAILCATYGSIRLWYAVLPLFFVLIGEICRHDFKFRPSSDRLVIVTMAMLTFFAVFFVHRRIFGEHYILEAVEKAWPSSFQGLFMPSLLLILGTSITVRVMNYTEYKGKIIAISLWLNFGLLVSLAENTYLDILTLLCVICLYAASLYYCLISINNNKSTIFGMAAISMQLLLTWGPWSAFASMLIISCSHKIWGVLHETNELEIDFRNNKTILAMAILPWAVWILWWTLLGQVNGLQTCFEGICPHPRELDPGTVIVRGGYVGARDNPNLYWMVFMVASPIFITSFMQMNNLQKSGLDLYPYIVFQSLIILGCISVIGFSPEYPRLVFSLTWNIFFAILQLITAVLVRYVRFGSHINRDKFTQDQSIADA